MRLTSALRRRGWEDRVGKHDEDRDEDDLEDLEDLEGFDDLGLPDAPGSSNRAANLLDIFYFQISDFLIIKVIFTILLYIIYNY